ncbi:MAG: malonic semialdehyde reductase [Proteobacteria bacterium]|nr:malonic semialdehyde reductase [Pseudomonadota bacterium]
MLEPRVTQQVFTNARTYSAFTPEPIADSTLAQLQELAQWGPTAFNCQPARYVFVRSAEGKARLQASLAPGNIAKVASAPVTVIVAIDLQFYEHLPTQFPGNLTLASSFAADPARAELTALRNGSLQGAYLMVAARLLGLDCGPMSGFNAAAVDQAFFPDGRWRSNFLVNLGYGEKSSLYPRGPRLPFSTCAAFI